MFHFIYDNFTEFGAWSINPVVSAGRAKNYCASIYDILAAIKMRFDMGLHHDDAVIVDIVEIIQELFDRELILYKEFSPHVN